MNLLRVDLVSQGVYKVYYHENGVYLGNILCKEDGFYAFWPLLKGGYWEAFMLRAIADKLDEMNQPWIDVILNDPNI